MDYESVKCDRCGEENLGMAVLLQVETVDRWICKECEYELKLWWLSGLSKKDASSVQ